MPKLGKGSSRLSKTVEQAAALSTEPAWNNSGNVSPVPGVRKRSFDTADSGCHKTKNSFSSSSFLAEESRLTGDALEPSNSQQPDMMMCCNLVSTKTMYDWAAMAIS